MKPRKIGALLLSLALLFGFCSMPVNATTSVDPMVSIGYEFAILLKDDGTAWSWGLNTDGILGNESVANGEKATCPIAVTMPIDNEQKPVRFQSVSAGYDHVLALATDGSIWAWGSNASGQLGIALFQASAGVPTRVDADFGGATVLSVVAGNCVSYALLSDKTVYAWGSNEQGLLGLGQNATSPQPIPQRIESLSGIVQVFAGANSAAAMTSGGKLLLWGKNVNRQCGISDVDTVWIPQTEKVGNYQATAVALGDFHTTMISVYAGVTSLQSFGSNTHGQYGLVESTATSNSTKLKAATLPDDLSGTPKAIAAGTNHMLMLTDGGAVYAWGSNENDKLGVESDNGAPNQYTPKRVTALAEATVVSIDAAYGLSAAIDELGAVYLWGAANDATLTTATPTQLQDANGGAFNLGAPSIDQEYTVFISANATVPRPTYTVTVPSTIEPDDLHQKRTDAEDSERISTTTFSVSATGIANFFGEKWVEVRLSADGDGFCLKDASNHVLEYQVYNSANGTTPFSSGEIFATFRESGSPSDTQTVTGRIEIDQSDIQFSGEYEGRVIFTVALMQQETEGGDGE